MSQHNETLVPPYYTRKGVDVWDVIEWWDCSYNVGCAVAYLLRHAHKNGVEDLQKAVRHISREVQQLSGDPTPTPGTGAGRP